MILNLKQYIVSFQTLLLVLTFLTVRVLSFLIAPYSTLQNILAALLVLTLVIFYIKKPEYAWYFVIAEIFLGGAGHFLEFFGLSIRTLFLVTYIFLYTVHRIFSKEKRNELLIPQNLYIFFGLFGLGLLWAAINGMIMGNDSTLIIQDLIPFAFFAILLPTHQMLKKRESQIFLLQLITAFIVGSFLFSLLTFIVFSSGHAVLQGPYYKWFRDIVAGKLTDLGSGFWRIVTPEHLLLLPITLVLSSVIASKTERSRHEKILLWSLLLASLFILTLNLSRGYFLALVIALFPLLYKHTFKKWFVTSTLIGLSIVIMFSGTYFIASHGKTFGLETFGLRLKSFTAPKIEESTYTRSALVGPIIEKIQAHPLRGSGLGSTVTFVNPVSQTAVTTPQFDWGYLELVTEFGIVGFILYLSLLATILYLTFRYLQTTTLHPDFFVGLLGGLTALLVANLTAPALSHVFGIVFFTAVLAAVLHTNEKWEGIKFHLTKFLH